MCSPRCPPRVFSISPKLPLFPIWSYIHSVLRDSFFSLSFKTTSPLFFFPLCFFFGGPPPQNCLRFGEPLLRGSLFPSYFNSPPPLFLFLSMDSYLFFGRPPLVRFPRLGCPYSLRLFFSIYQRLFFPGGSKTPPPLP